MLQYGARFKKEDMERLLRARGGMSKKQCQVLFADEGEVAAMTGFVHNSVTPVGMDCEMPIFLSHHVVRTRTTATPLPRSLRRQEPACVPQDELPGGEFWMGGGAVNLKLKVKTELFKKAYGVVVGDVTVTQ